MSTVLRLKRRLTGAAGAPGALKSAEPSYNMADGRLYIGFGDDTNGNATGVKVFGADDFIQNLPAAVAGKILGYNAGVWAPIDPPASGGTYTAGTGLTLTGGAFAVDFTNAAQRSWVTTNFAPVAHTHSAADITSGTLDPARLPASVFQAPIVAASNIASLTAPQQAEIRVGSTVVTSDGRFWSYITGTKTLEASYREMADTTPEWSAIANRPTFATVATTGAYNDLTGKPSLGTMAAQNANAVAITGGTIDGVTLDGGTF